MPRTDSKRGRSKKPGSSNSKMDVLHQDMKSLIELSRAQETKFVPEVADVPRIRFSRSRLFNVEVGYNYMVTLSGTTATIGAITFLLSNATNSANFTACFDQYRIIQVNVKFITSVSAGLFLYTVLDYDDANIEAGQASFLGYDNLKVTPFGQIDERTLTPRLAAAAYSGSFTSYANMPSSTFIDSASPSVQYYGLKYFTPSGVGTFTAVVTMMVQFRGQRAT